MINMFRMVHSERPRLESPLGDGEYNNISIATLLIYLYCIKAIICFQGFKS